MAKAVVKVKGITLQEPSLAPTLTVISRSICLLKSRRVPKEDGLIPPFPVHSYDPEEDWLDDNKGEPQMDFPDFFDAMFELADMW